MKPLIFSAVWKWGLRTQLVPGGAEVAPGCGPGPIGDQTKWVCRAAWPRPTPAGRVSGFGLDNPHPRTYKGKTGESGRGQPQPGAGFARLPAAHGIQGPDRRKDRHLLSLMLGNSSRLCRLCLGLSPVSHEAEKPRSRQVWGFYYFCTECARVSFANRGKNE